MYWLYVSPGTVTGSNLSLYKDNEEYPSIKDEASIIFALLESGQTYRVEHPDDELDHMFWWYEDLKETYYPREYTLYAKRSECNTLHENVAHSFTTSELISIDTWIDNTYRNFSNAFFSFTPTFGGSYQFNVSSSDYCSIEIYNYNGQYISSNNSTYALNSNEQYIVIIGSIEGNATGSITVKKADETNPAKITGFYPGNDSRLSYVESSMLRINFDREVLSGQVRQNYADLDFSKTPLTVYRASDDKVLYRVTENNKEGISFDVTSYTSSPTAVNISITNLNSILEGGEQYYITMGAGFVKLADGTASPEIKKGEWLFSISKTIQDIDRWNFVNGDWNFAINGASVPNGYYITSTDYNRLTKKLSSTEKAQLEKTLWVKAYNVDNKAFHLISNNYIGWKGSCYGMSVWACLAAQGIRNASEIESTYSSLFDVEPPSSNSYVASSINFYQHQQRLTTIKSQQDLFMSMKQQTQLRVLDNVATEADTQDKYAIVMFEWKSDDGNTHQHATVAFGIENGSWRLDANGIMNDYTHRVLVYDCSYPYSGSFDDYCIYFNDDSWCIPGYDIMSTSNQISNDHTNNGRFLLITNKISYLNSIDFITGNVSSSVTDSSTNVILGLATSRAFKVQDGDQSCYINAGEVVESTFEEQLNIIADAAITVDNTEGMPQFASLVLHNLNAKYTIESQDPICYDIKYPNYYMAAISSASGEVAYSPAGGVQLIGDTAGECAVELVADDGYHTIPWYDITVTGSELNEISAEWVTEGVKVSGDNLNKLSVTASNDNETVTLEVNTDYDDILLKDNNGSLGAYVDTNHDGIFETLIKEDENYHPGSGNGGSPSTNYLVDVKSSEHGNISVNRRMVSHGEEVIIFVSPDEGYALDTLRVVDKNGHNIVVTGDNNRYSFKMPASDVTISGTFIKVIANDIFVDVDINDYYYNAVLWANENGITKGTSSTAFSPDANCTRGQVVTFLWRAVGSPTPQATTMPFVDIPADAYYYDAVLWAVENGITKGTSATKFSPDAICTRSQVVTFLWRVEGAPSFQKVDLRFDDVPQNAYYFNAVLWADTEKITTGTSTNTFSPMAYCTRAEIVTLIWRWSSM